MIRRATPADLTAITVFAKAKHEASNYAPIGFNAVWFRQQLERSICDAESFVWICIESGEVKGLLIGCYSQMFQSPKRCAADQFFVADKGGEELFEAFVKWCEANRVVRIDTGNSQVERKGFDRLMQSRGFERAGGVYFRNMELRR